MIKLNIFGLCKNNAHKTLNVSLRSAYQLFGITPDTSDRILSSPGTLGSCVDGGISSLCKAAIGLRNKNTAIVPILNVHRKQEFPIMVRLTWLSNDHFLTEMHNMSFKKTSILKFQKRSIDLIMFRNTL